MSTSSALNTVQFQPTSRWQEHRREQALPGRFSANNGVEAMKAMAAGRDPMDDMAALSQESDAEEDS